ncbi:MAG: YHS domain-containing (seleno)protein [Acidobacteriota bacterium]
MNPKKALLSTLVIALVTGAAILPAQVKSEPAIGGYCPVAYVQANMAAKGDAAFSTVSSVDGRTYYLSNAMAKEMFDKMPEKYTPAYDGFCATAVARGMKVKSNPTLFVVEDGKTYLFSTEQAKRMFDMNRAGTIEKANANWPKVSAMKAM